MENQGWLKCLHEALVVKHNSVIAPSTRASLGRAAAAWVRARPAHSCGLRPVTTTPPPIGPRWLGRGPPLVRAPATFWPRPWRMVQWGVKTLHNLNMHINSVRVSEYHWINEAASCVKYWWVTQVTLLHTCSARHASLCLTLPVLMWTVVLDLNDSIKESVRPTHEYSSYCTHALLGYFIQFQSADIFCRKKAQKEIMWPSLAWYWCCCVAVVVGIIKLIQWLQNIIKLHILCCVPNPAQCCEPFSSLRPAVVCGSTGARHQTLSITHFSLYKICCLPSPSLIQYFDS